jgi:hypothetical protein
MAYPQLRSMNASLQHGATIDGKYKQPAPDRGGMVESGFKELRLDLDHIQYGHFPTSVPNTPQM